MTILRNLGITTTATSAPKAETPTPISVSGSSSLLDARFWLALSPWRITAGWSLLAAGLASGISGIGQQLSLEQLVMLFLLVDPLWGSLWGGFSTPQALPQLQDSVRQNRLWLPYLAPGSPAARLFGWESPGILPVLFRAGLPSLLLAFVVAFAVEPQAIWATLAVVVLAVGGWLHRQTDLIPIPVLHSLVVVTVPWFLGLTLFGQDPWNPVHLWPVLLWTIHAWGGTHQLERPSERIGLIGMAVAQVGMGIYLIAGRSPLWLAILALLWLPTWLTVHRGQSVGPAQLWWTAAMLVSALAASQITF